MSVDGSVHVHRVWKRFRADRHRALLRDELARLRAWTKGQNELGWRWALRDVSFDVQPGEAVALVGANGSGKSTMLKMLVGVMFPYAGRIETTGRIGALIEVRAGIHPELTGRENVFMYGTLLGLSRKAVATRFDDIVAFAGLDQAIDRQVKFYSSGMSMRLGFAVAAFLDPAILVVDEVLAVGDAQFQQRCLDRMRDVLAAGTTLLFVSHDLATVEAMCRRAVWLEDGQMRLIGPVREVLAAYRQSVERAVDVQHHDGPVQVLKVDCTALDGSGPVAGQALEVTTYVVADRNQRARLVLGVSEGTATPIFVVQHDVELNTSQTSYRCVITHLPVPAGRYSLWLAVIDLVHHELVPWHSAAHFDVSGAALEAAPTGVVRLSPVYVPTTWDL